MLLKQNKLLIRDSFSRCDFVFSLSENDLHQNQNSFPRNDDTNHCIIVAVFLQHVVLIIRHDPFLPRKKHHDTMTFIVPLPPQPPPLAILCLSWCYGSWSQEVDWCIVGGTFFCSRFRFVSRFSTLLALYSFSLSPVLVFSFLDWYRFGWWLFLLMHCHFFLFHARFHLLLGLEIPVVWSVRFICWWLLPPVWPVLVDSSQFSSFSRLLLLWCRFYACRMIYCWQLLWFFSSFLIALSLVPFLHFSACFLGAIIGSLHMLDLLSDVSVFGLIVGTSLVPSLSSLISVSHGSFLIAHCSWKPLMHVRGWMMFCLR